MGASAPSRRGVGGVVAYASREKLREYSRKRPARKREVRAHSLSVRELSAPLEAPQDYPEWAHRPGTRGECAGGERPCPFVSCPYHLYLDVSPRTGSIKLNFPDLEVWELAETCILDAADRGDMTLEKIGELMNLTRERARQIEASALEKVRDREGLREFEDE